MSQSLLAKLMTRRLYLGAVIATMVVVAVGGILASWYSERERREQLHSEREETELLVTNLSGASLHLFKVGNTLRESTELPTFNGRSTWLAQGNYFLEAVQNDRSFFYSVPLIGYRGGPETDGAFSVTIRSAVPETPPRLLPELPEMAYIPSGHFLLGDRLNPREPHYVWVPAFYASPFEVTNAEFREFLKASQGYSDNSNWTEEGRRWKSKNSSMVTAALNTSDVEFERFGQPNLPTVRVNWFEANAYCRWLTRTIGKGKWVFSLPTDAEWEKAARGPDNFDYALGMTISDHEVSLYNWKKNPEAPVTVVGLHESQSNYRPNRYGLYHMSGNVSEWTQSVNRPFNKEHPYVDDDRNYDKTAGLRVVRGGSWYSASIAILYLPYRETFQPDVSTPYLGFRVVARLLP